MAWLIWETFPQTCYNYELMMGQAVAHVFVPIIKFLYNDDPEKKKDVMRREIEFFNVHIEFGACIIGMAIAMEEQKAMGEEIPSEFITNIKTSLMGPLAGVGDTIWQGVVIPILLAICIDITVAYAKANVLVTSRRGLVINSRPRSCRSQGCAWRGVRGTACSQVHGRLTKPAVLCPLDDSYAVVPDNRIPHRNPKHLR